MLLGSLHVELSRGRRGNHPPLQQPAPPTVPVDRVEVWSVLPPTLKKGHVGTTHTCSSARRHLYSNRLTGGPVRYSKGSVGDHRSRESNHLLHGKCRLRCHLSGCLLRGTVTRHRDQPHKRTHQPQMQAPWRHPPSPPPVWLYVDLRKSQYPVGFLNPKDLNSPRTVAVAHKGDL